MSRYDTSSNTLQRKVVVSKECAYLLINEEGVDDSVAKRVDGQLGDELEVILAAQQT